jgi:AraC-like DNA-binding protein
MSNAPSSFGDAPEWDQWDHHRLLLFRVCAVVLGAEGSFIGGQATEPFSASPLYVVLRMQKEPFKGTLDSRGTLASGESSMPDAIRLQKYRELVRQQMGQFPPTLFQDLTGLQFQVAWVPSAPSAWNNPEPAAQPSGNRGTSAAAASAEERCRNCCTEHVALVLETRRESHCCTCPLGAGTGWIPIVIQKLVVGIASIRSIDTFGGAHVPHYGNMAQIGRQPRTLRTDFPLAKRTKTAHSALSQFDHAMSLLRLIVHYFETTVQAELTRIELMKAEQRVFEQEHEETRLRADLSRALRTGQPRASAPEHETRPEQLIHRMLAFIQKNLARPITLQDCAGELRLNRVYLCTLFARVVGIPFKAYLIRLRIEKAKELLSDPVQRASEVAFAVGYTDEDYFRRAFKAATGLSPAAWRGALRAHTKSKESPG